MGRCPSLASTLFSCFVCAESLLIQFQKEHYWEPWKGLDSDYTYGAYIHLAWINGIAKAPGGTNIFHTHTHLRRYCFCASKDIAFVLLCFCSLSKGAGWHSLKAWHLGQCTPDPHLSYATGLDRLCAHRTNQSVKIHFGTKEYGPYLHLYAWLLLFRQSEKGYG